MDRADCCRWEGGEPGHAPSTLFAGAFDSHYSNPAGFCWDINCVDDPINDDPSIEGYNVDEVLQYPLTSMPSRCYSVLRRCIPR